MGLNFGSNALLRRRGFWACAVRTPDCPQPVRGKRFGQGPYLRPIARKPTSWSWRATVSGRWSGSRVGRIPFSLDRPLTSVHSLRPCPRFSKRHFRSARFFAVRCARGAISERAC